MAFHFNFGGFDPTGFGSGFGGFQSGEGSEGGFTPPPKKEQKPISRRTFIITIAAMLIFSLLLTAAGAKAEQANSSKNQ